LSNPFEIVEDDPSKYVPAKALHLYIGKQVTCLAYFIAHKHVTTKNSNLMYFGTFVDSELNWIDTVHFPEVAKKYPLNNSGFYRIIGKVMDDFGAYSIEVSRMYKIGYKKRSYENLG
jgi:DNA polymerase-3 subunit alpha